MVQARWRQLLLAVGNQNKTPAIYTVEKMTCPIIEPLVRSWESVAVLSKQQQRTSQLYNKVKSFPLAKAYKLWMCKIFQHTQIGYLERAFVELELIYEEKKSNRSSSGFFFTTESLNLANNTNHNNLFDPIKTNFFQPWRQCQTRLHILKLMSPTSPFGYLWSP